MAEEDGRTAEIEAATAAVIVEDAVDVVDAVVVADADAMDAAGVTAVTEAEDTKTSSPRINTDRSQRGQQQQMLPLFFGGRKRRK